MTVLYLISKILTFPAVMLRAVCEHIILKSLKVPVEDASYTQMNELFGHTEHDLIKNTSANTLFCCVPGLLQIILAVPMMAVSFIQLFVLGVTPTDPQTGTVSAMFVICMILRIFGIWLLCNIFPLYEDALGFFENACDEKGIKKILTVPLAAIVRTGSFLEKNGITVFIWIAETVLLFLVT